MMIRKISADNETIRFVLEDATPAFANALRRIMLSEVGALAIEDVSFFENSSGLYDEMFALRLGLVPIKTDSKTFKYQDACVCKGKGCPKCQVTFALNKKGPGMVYSGDMKSSDPKTVVADEKIPLVKLLDGQKVKIEAVAVLGQAQKHAKFQAGLAAYEFYPKITVKDAAKVRSTLEQSAHKADIISKSGSVNMEHLETCTSCLIMAEESGEGAVEIERKKNAFIFNVESYGALKPEEIVTQAAEILAEKAKEFGKLLK